MLLFEIWFVDSAFVSDSVNSVISHLTIHCEGKGLSGIPEDASPQKSVVFLKKSWQIPASQTAKLDQFSQERRISTNFFVQQAQPVSSSL